MRNVTMWTRDWDLHRVSLDRPFYYRLYVYKGVPRTLNEFLYPELICRDKHIVPRDRNQSGVNIPFDLKKGQVVLLGWNLLRDKIDKNYNNSILVFESYEDAIDYLVQKDYRFYGEEQANNRARKLKLGNHSSYQKYHDQIDRAKAKIASRPAEVLKQLEAKHAVDVIPACVDKTKDAGTQPVASSAPEPKAKKTFFENMLGFLKVFTK